MDVVTSKLIDALLGKIGGFIQERWKLHGELRSDLDAIKSELGMINATIKDEDDERRRSPRKTAMTQGVWIQIVSELALDIEDCLDLHAGSPKAKSAFLGWLTRQAKMLGSASTHFAKEIKELRKRAEDAQRLKRTYAGAPYPAPGPGPSTAFRDEKDLVGIDEPKKEVLGLLQLEGTEGCCNVVVGGGGCSQQAVQPKSLKVVSIVGPRGLGKTTLARVVYKSLVAEFECRAWVDASQCMNANELLAQVLHLTGGEAATFRDAELGAKLAGHLTTKARYLIVIDDLQLHDWEAIKHAFPDNGLGGRIIVTTSVKTIANMCGSERGSVYKMQTLSKKLSRELLMKNVFNSPNQCPHDLRDAADEIVDKCDGLPLALVSIGQHLNSLPHHDLTEDRMKEVCTYLGDYLEKNATLDRMREALIRTYYSLPGHDLKNCLLSVSIFPKGYPIKKKSLVRRWLAEGLVDKADDVGNRADKYFEELMDRNVIQPADGSNDATVKKSCHIHGVMLDFIVHKSVSEKFVTLVHKDTQMNREVARRLSLQNTSNSEEAPSGRIAEIDLSRVRSLAIFNHDGKDLSKFETCKLLRALDLDECKGLKDDILDSICELLHLKYLSLRGTQVSKLPKKMYKLQALETLDIRRTGVGVLPMGVLVLPKLVHLFGQFRLPSGASGLHKVGASRKKKHKFSAEKSQLQTLAGFLVDQSSGFEHIMGHMKRLRKVKVWCGAGDDAPPPPVSSAAPDNLLIPPPKIQLSQSIKSLSVDFGDRPINFLYNIDTQTPYSCESITIKGKLLDKLPDFMLSLHTLRELRLVSFDLASGALAELGRLNRLRYLKLSDNHTADTSKFSKSSFHIQSGWFPSLVHLCFETPKLPEVSIQAGAVPKLTYLQLFCKDVEGLDVKDMAKLENLEEVTLAESVPAKAMEAWEEAAKAHIKRPAIKTRRCYS